MALFEKFDSNIRSVDLPPSIHIRPAKLSDLQGVAQLYATRNETTLERSLLSIKRSLPKGHWVVAIHFQKGLVGYGRSIYFKPPKDVPDNCVPEGWYLMGMIVDEGFRRQNIGYHLTLARMKRLQSKAERVYYFANSLNLASIALHAKVGFRVVKTKIWFPGVTFSNGGVGTLFVKDINSNA